MNILSDLVALGFTEYEAKIYTALLKESPANGYQLSKKSGVPRSMVYEALGRLHSRGAVLKTGNERATFYQPLPPEQLLDRYKRHHLDLIENLRENLMQIYDVHVEDSLWTISGIEAVISYAAQMLAGAQTEIYLVLDDYALENLRDEIQAGCDRGLPVGALLTGSGDLKCSQVSYHPPVESEMQEIETMLVVVADSQECLIADLKQDVKATITRNKNLVLITRQFVWMELFSQRIYERLGPSLLDLLEMPDREILQGYSIKG